MTCNTKVWTLQWKIIRRNSLWWSWPCNYKSDIFQWIIHCIISFSNIVKSATYAPIDDNVAWMWLDSQFGLFWALSVWLMVMCWNTVQQTLATPLMYKVTKENWCADNVVCGYYTYCLMDKSAWSTVCQTTHTQTLLWTGFTWFSAPAAAWLSLAEPGEWQTDSARSALSGWWPSFSLSWQPPVALL